PVVSNGGSSRMTKFDDAEARRRGWISPGEYRLDVEPHTTTQSTLGQRDRFLQIILDPKDSVMRRRGCCNTPSLNPLMWDKPTPPDLLNMISELPGDHNRDVLRDKRSVTYKLVGLIANYYSLTTKKFETVSRKSTTALVLVVARGDEISPAPNHSVV